MFSRCSKFSFPNTAVVKTLFGATKHNLRRIFTNMNEIWNEKRKLKSTKSFLSAEIYIFIILIGHSAILIYRIRQIFLTVQNVGICSTNLSMSIFTESCPCEDFTQVLPASPRDGPSNASPRRCDSDVPEYWLSEVTELCKY